jgi:predicted  nucleic acid-binding Zn-ribbon protein
MMHMHKLINEYRSLCLEIATIESQIKTGERELTKLTYTYKPTDIKGIDYAKPQIQSSRHAPDIVEVASKIYKLSGELSELRAERDRIHAQRAELDKCIDHLGDMQAKVAMLRLRGRTNRQIAHDVGYSKRHVERIIRDISRALEKTLII